MTKNANIKLNSNELTVLEACVNAVDLTRNHKVSPTYNIKVAGFSPKQISGYMTSLSRKKLVNLKKDGKDRSFSVSKLTAQFIDTGDIVLE